MRMQNEAKLLLASVADEARTADERAVQRLQVPEEVLEAAGPKPWFPLLLPQDVLTTLIDDAIQLAQFMGSGL